MPTPLFRFGRFTLDPHKRLLAKDGAHVALGPRVVETLVVLVECAGELVTKDELMTRLWPDRCVEEGNLTQNVHLLRRALSEGGLPGAIETMARRGYRFVAAVDRPGAHETARRSAPRRMRWTPAFAIACVMMLFITASTPRAHGSSAYARLSSESQRLYTVGRYHLNLRSDSAHLNASVRYFEDVVKRDPGNPLGYSGLSDAYVAFFDYYCDSTQARCRDVVARAVASARKAVAVDPSSAEAFTSLAMVTHVFARQETQADAHFAHAIQLDDRYALAHAWFGNSLLLRGLLAPARREFRAALALEPAAPTTYAWLAHDAFFSRQYRDAVAYARESLAINPRRREMRALLGLAYEQLGDQREAVRTWQPLPEIQRRALSAELYARNGDRARALATLRTIRQRDAVESGCTLEIAFAWIALGDPARAGSFIRTTPLTNTVTRRFLALDPRLDAVRSDPRLREWTALN